MICLFMLCKSFTIKNHILFYNIIDVLHYIIPYNNVKKVISRYIITNSTIYYIVLK